ncbi:MAG: putative nucleotidyltransferase [Paucimonas sp.]|nr:putative nucleotidyltransferase [Paucimonas sp.]
MTSDGVDDEGGATRRFYRTVMELLNEAGIDFMVGGAFAFHCYTGIRRDTKDLDLFIRRDDFDELARALASGGYRTELTYPHWLGKIRDNGDLIDVIFNSGNGVACVDDEWLSHAPEATVLDVPVRICPVEENIWSKAFILERERYDGADIAHLIHARARNIDWVRLLRRFDPHWRVLLSHLVLFGFIYPAERDLVPNWVLQDLVERLQLEMRTPPPPRPVCGGTLLSREQYLVDVQEQGYMDARIEPLGSMSPEHARIWTDAIPGRAGN